MGINLSFFAYSFLESRHHISYRQLRREETWINAQRFCSRCNETLIDVSDPTDFQYVREKINTTSKAGIWIGLKKNASNVSEFKTNDRLKIRWCLSANIGESSALNVSCVGKLLPSICRKDAINGKSALICKSRMRLKSVFRLTRLVQKRMAFVFIS